MKALSLTQPWATLIAIGEKRIETRNWSTKHRGPVAIHAAKGFPRKCVALCAEWPFEDALLRHREGWPKGLPIGAIVAVARLVDVVPTLDFFAENLMGRPNRRGLLTNTELAFGDYSLGRFGWLLADVRRLPEPIPCKGARGLWDVPAAIGCHVEPPTTPVGPVGP